MTNVLSLFFLTLWAVMFTAAAQNWLCVLVILLVTILLGVAIHGYDLPYRMEQQRLISKVASYNEAMKEKKTDQQKEVDPEK